MGFLAFIYTCVTVYMFQWHAMVMTLTMYPRFKSTFKSQQLAVSMQHEHSPLLSTPPRRHTTLRTARGGSDGNNCNANF